MLGWGCVAGAPPPRSRAVPTKRRGMIIVQRTMPGVFCFEVDTVTWWHALVDEEKVDTLFAARKQPAT